MILRKISSNRMQKYCINYSKDQFFPEFEEIVLHISVSSGRHTSTGCQTDENGLLVKEAFTHQLISSV